MIKEVNLSGIIYDVTFTEKVTRGADIDSIEVEVDEITDVEVNGESIIWTDYTYQGRPLVEVLEERVR